VAAGEVKKHGTCELCGEKGQNRLFGLYGKTAVQITAILHTE